MIKVNAINLLFKVTLDIKHHNETYIEINPTQEIVVIVEKCLQTNVITTSTSNAITKCSTIDYKTRLKQFAKK
jgi:hypothetical protein